MKNRFPGGRLPRDPLIVDHQEQLLKLVAVEPPVLLAAVPA
jgi:hypothetical protein